MDGGEFNNRLCFKVANDEVKGRAYTSEYACCTSMQAVVPHFKCAFKTGSIRRHAVNRLNLEMTME